ncbi:hypothetical protein PM082_022875 [Marasmius tenuissimus]|nr:hypothetical protein PM082_022875 [Marasmius tenuissimus]
MTPSAEDYNIAILLLTREEFREVEARRRSSSTLSIQVENFDATQLFLIYLVLPSSLTGPNRECSSMFELRSQQQWSAFITECVRARSGSKVDGLLEPWIDYVFPVSSFYTRVFSSLSSFQGAPYNCQRPPSILVEYMTKIKGTCMQSPE